MSFASAWGNEQLEHSRPVLRYATLVGVVGGVRSMIPFFVDKAILAGIRRLNPTLSSVYLPGIGQVIELPGEASSVYQEVFIRKTYRPISPLKPAARILDLGAHLGFFTIYASTLSDGARITAIEANPNTIPLLKANLSRLKGNASVEVRQAAIAAEPGTLAFRMHRSKPAHVSGSAARSMEGYPDEEDFCTIHVEAVPFSGFLSEPIDLLKCDIEGSEFEILTPDSFRPDRIRQAAVEFHDIGPRAKEFTALVGGAMARGYRVFTSEDIPIADLDALARATDGIVNATQLKFAG